MLRAIPDKLFGVMVMGGSIVILLFVPWLDRSPVRSMRYKGNYSRFALWTFVIVFVILGYLGATMLTPLKLYLARICTVLYFAFFLLMPIYSKFEQYRVVPDRILR
jgi:ubiquinol-cytochrome c reductase cytochrome b subunit